MDRFALSDIQIVVRKAPKPEVPMFEQTMSLLMMIKEQKEMDRQIAKDQKIRDLAMLQKKKMEQKKITLGKK